MNAKHEKQEELIFYSAIEKDPADREAYLKEICGKNHKLYKRVEALLQAYDTDESIHHISYENSQVTLDSLSNPENPGSMIGRYKLLERIGEGGFGAVWTAEQKKPVKRRVALKIIKMGMDTKQVVARFEAERQALALMDHPNIAKVLDAGSTDTGRPYFVMELVRGIPITKYCDQEKLSTHDRLNLFIKVCNAVQHAHQKGIIHRDIKPSNILITLHDGVPVPRIIDFGIAKATQQELTEMTIYTRHDQFIGTPAYMSPEQAEMSGLDIDTRSDIYSLGVLLYELLTGKTPFDEKELMRSGIDEMRKIIREQDPPKPSTKFATLEIEEQSTTATRHSTESPRLISLLRGDLDWIVMKCLEKDRIRRYETANGLAMDVVRHMRNEPVIARPPTVIYQLQKAWRRNKVVYTAAIIVVVSLIIGISLSVWEAIEATRAEKQANENAILARKSEINALQRAYNSDMSLAYRALEENLFGPVQDIVNQHVLKPGEPDFRGWEWRYAWAQSQSDAVLTWDTPEEMIQISTVRISPDQRYLISSEAHPKFWDGGVIRRLWNFETREELKDVNLPMGSQRGVVFSNSGKYLALDCGNKPDGHEIQICDTATWDIIATLPSEIIGRSLSFSPDDNMLAMIGPSAAVLWNWRQRKIIYELPIQMTGRGWHDTVAFFPEGHRLAIVGDGELKIFDVTTGNIEYHEPAPVEGVPLAISPDSCYVVMGSGYLNNKIRVLNTTSPDPNLWKQEAPLEGHGRWITSLTFTTNGEKLISSSGDNTIRVWDMNSRASTRVLKGHQSFVSTVSLTSDNFRAVSAGTDKHILEWDLNAPPSPFREYVLADVRQVVFSADSRSFYTINENGLVSIWDAETFDKQQSLSPELGENSSIILSVDGEHLIAGTGSGELLVLDAGDIQIVARRGPSSGQILPVGFWADGKSLVALESDDKITQWNVDTWQLRSRVESGLHIERYLKRRFAIPPDSDILLCPSDEDIVWWDLAQSKKLDRIPFNTRRKDCIAVSPVEPLLAVACGSDFIFLWDWQNRQFVDQLRSTNGFYCVAFSPDGRRLVSGSMGKGAFMLWDISARQEIARFGTTTATTTELQFSPDGNTICAVDNKGIAYFFRAPSFEEIKTIEARQLSKERR